MKLVGIIVGRNAL